LVAIDWGTSSLRGARLDADGAALEERAFPHGILTVPAGGFRAVFDAHFGDWMQQPAALCLIAGMAGSRQGWLEAPYCPCPAGFDEVAQQLAWIEPGRIAIVPGLRCEQGGVPDVMRGEETQVFGALRLTGWNDGLLVLPGTHSKWVQVRGGRIEHFATLMTGEFYALLRRHSILARTMPSDEAEGRGELHGAAFDAGVALALRGGSLLQHAFSVRSLALFDRLTAAQAPSYLSGLVIGEELHSSQLERDTQVLVVGDPSLTHRYQRALVLCGVSARCIGAPAMWRGLHELAARLDVRDGNSPAS
jgi:2-dehydro-3-deoxygalactonokinase